MYYWGLFCDLTYNLPLKVFHGYLRRIGIPLLGEYMIFFLATRHIYCRASHDILTLYFSVTNFHFVVYLFIALLFFWIFVLESCFTFWSLITFATLHTSIIVSLKALWFISDISALSKPFYVASVFSFYMDKTFLFLCIFKNTCWKRNMLEMCCSNSES